MLYFVAADPHKETHLWIFPVWPVFQLVSLIRVAEQVEMAAVVPGRYHLWMRANLSHSKVQHYAPEFLCSPYQVPEVFCLAVMRNQLPAMYLPRCRWIC